MATSIKTTQNDADETMELGAVGGEDQIDQVIDRLPKYLQMQWAERAESILKLGKRPRFSKRKYVRSFNSWIYT